MDLDREAAIDALRLHEPAVVTLDLGLPPDAGATLELLDQDGSVRARSGEPR